MASPLYVFMALAMAFVLLSVFRQQKSNKSLQEETKKGMFIGTYGELTSTGMKQLLSNFSSTKDMVFCDLGCGYGSTLLYALDHGDFRQAIGVELEPKRAAEARKRTRPIYPKVRIYEASLFEDRFFEMADIYYVSNLLFSEKMQKELGRKFSKREKKGIICVFTSKPFPVDKDKLVKQVKLPPVRQTWTENGASYATYIKIK